MVIGTKSVLNFPDLTDWSHSSSLEQVRYKDKGQSAKQLVAFFREHIPPKDSYGTMLSTVAKWQWKCLWACNYTWAHTHCYLRLKYWWSHILLAHTKPGDTPMFINRRSPMSTTGRRVDIGTPGSTTDINWSSTPMNIIDSVTSKRTLCDTDLHHRGNRFIFPCYSRRMESPDPRYSH